MAYQALYRKWRPRTFSEMIGQDAIMTALRNQVRSGRIGHAYLFCGTRGTGKTSAAKIFARAVNCMHPVDGNPCNECELCLEGETDFNVVEIDAASNNGVDNIRDLRDEVRYAPARGKYRVYIIDEVHMLSASAFNALLKTLEEPPAHVIFILATTEPHKILPTILSRCQRYDFRRIGARDLTGHLIRICAAEQIDIDEDALRYIADAADGACRDALSILDQCAAFYMNEHITTDMVLDVLGATDRRLFHTMTGILMNRDRKACLEQLEELFASGRDTSRFLLDWISYLRSVLLLQMMGNEALSYLAVPESTLADMQALAARCNPDAVSYYIEELARLELSLRTAAEKRILLEVGLLRLCRLEDTVPNALLARVERVERTLANGIPAVPASAPASPETAAAPKPSRLEPGPVRQASPEPTVSQPSEPTLPSFPPAGDRVSDQQWNQIRDDLKRESRGYVLLDQFRLLQNDTGIYLITANDFMKSQILHNNRERLTAVAARLRAIAGNVPVQAMTEAEFGLMNGRGPATEDPMDAIFQNINGPIRFK